MKSINLTNLKIKIFIFQNLDSQSQPPKVIFSLTSFPARIKFVHHTIFSLLTQSTKADEIALFLIAGTPKVLVPNHIDNPADHLASFESPNLYHKNFAPKDGGQNYFEKEFNNLMRAYPQAKSLILESISCQIC